EYLASGQPELEEFALAIFKTSRSLGELDTSQWLALLEGATPNTRDAIVEAMRQHLPAERLTFDDCLQLALAEPATVAQYGFDLLRDRVIDSPDEQRRLAELADSRCAALAGEMARWALEQV